MKNRTLRLCLWGFGLVMASGVTYVWFLCTDGRDDAYLTIPYAEIGLSCISVREDTVVVGAMDGTVSRWKLDLNRKQLKHLQDVKMHQDTVTGAVIVRGDTIVTCSNDERCVTVDLAQMTKRAEATNAYSLRCLCHLPNRNEVALGAANGSIVMFSIVANMMYQAHSGREEPIVAIAASADESHLAVSWKSGYIGIFKLGTALVCCGMVQSGSRITALAFADGSTAISGDRDGMIKSWSVRDLSMTVVAKIGEPIVRIALDRSRGDIAVIGSTRIIRVLTPDGEVRRQMNTDGGLCVCADVFATQESYTFVLGYQNGTIKVYFLPREGVLRIGHRLWGTVGDMHCAKERKTGEDGGQFT